jgi:hypothetical protein
MPSKISVLLGRGMAGRATEVGSVCEGFNAEPGSGVVDVGGGASELDTSIALVDASDGAADEISDVALVLFLEGEVARLLCLGGPLRSPLVDDIGKPPERP